MDKSIVITMDTDWVPDEVLEYSLNLLDSHGVRATLFMTNPVKLDTKNHEIGIHPNFTSFDFKKHIKECLEIYPQAKGVRSHSLFYSERLREVYSHYDIEYQSNFMMYRQSGIRPLWIAPTTLELPLYWMDNFYMEMEQAPGFEIGELTLNIKGLKVFCFHPIHIFLNTERLDRYDEAKNYHNDVKKLLEMRNVNRRGVKDIFLELVRYIKENNIESKVLGDISKSFKNS
ncbi:MAG: hypothetical protein NG737_01655 [Omnitrophica bacterium]|nr:hypothetical protein [Candidatus Omnitrophota bacterium]